MIYHFIIYYLFIYYLLKIFPPRLQYRRGGFVLVNRKTKQRRCGQLTNGEFTELMQQYQRLVYTVCLQFVHDPHTAEDLTQDTFLSAFGHRPMRAAVL